MDSKDNTMKKRSVWIFLGAIILLGAAFWGLNFRLAFSNTQSEKNITTSSIGDGLPYAMQRREKIKLALIGEGPLIAALQKALTLEMTNAGIGDMELVQGVESQKPNPVLVIKVAKPGVLWTPFFATSQFMIQAAYSSSGDTAVIGEVPVTIDNKEGPALTMYGEFKIGDRSWGLISRPGYHEILAKSLAREIIAAVKDLYRLPV